MTLNLMQRGLASIVGKQEAERDLSDGSTTPRGPSAWLVGGDRTPRECFDALFLPYTDEATEHALIDCAIEYYLSHVAAKAWGGE